MTYAHLREGYSVEHGVGRRRRLFAGRVVFHDGEVAPGVSVHPSAATPRGIQAVVVRTARGPLVPASNTAHFHGNFEQDRPFLLVHEVQAVLRD